MVLQNNGRNLTAKVWRTFQLQFEIAAERVEDKGERKEYKMLLQSTISILARDGGKRGNIQDIEPKLGPNIVAGEPSTG